MVERSPEPCGISGSAEPTGQGSLGCSRGPPGARGGCVTAELSARTRGLVKRAQDHVNNGTSQAQTPGYRGCHCHSPCPTQMTDMTCYEEPLSTSIQGSSLYPIIHTMGGGGSCHRPNAGEFKLLLGISSSPPPASPAGTSVSMLHSNHPIRMFFDGVENPTFTTVRPRIVFRCCCA